MPATALANPPCQTPSSTRKFYRPRDHAASPFFKIVRERFDEFVKVYPERYQKRFGYWRPVIGTSIEKFLKPVVSLPNHAEIPKKDSPVFAVPIAARNGLSHFLAVNVRPVLHAIRSVLYFWLCA